MVGAGWWVIHVATFFAFFGLNLHWFNQACHMVYLLDSDMAR